MKIVTCFRMIRLSQDNPQDRVFDLFKDRR